MTGDGQVRLELRHPRRDGTTALVFDPVAYLGRLAVLVPRPRINRLLYHGVLGARSAWRAEHARHRRGGAGAFYSDATVVVVATKRWLTLSTITPNPSSVLTPRSDISPGCANTTSSFVSYPSALRIA